METEDKRIINGVLTVMKDILDMMSPENMDKLLLAVKLMPIETPSLLAAVADLVYEKALEEDKLCSTVAIFCKGLSKLTVPCEGIVNGKQELKFSRLIINKCQWEFERDHMENTTSLSSDSGDNSHPEDDPEMKNAKLRRRSHVNIQLIGELYNEGMLAPSIVERIIEVFILESDDENLSFLHTFLTTIGKRFKIPLCCEQEELKLNKKSEVEHQMDSEKTGVRQRALGNMKVIRELFFLHVLTPNFIMRIIAILMNRCDDESLECVCTLLTMAGRVLEMQCLQQIELMWDLNSCFRKLKDIIVNGTSISSRVRCIITEVLDLRLNGWFPLRENHANDRILYSENRDYINASTRHRISDMKPGWNPDDVFQIRHPRSYGGYGPDFIKPKPLGGYSSDAGWVYHEDLSRLHPIDRRYIPQNGKMNVEFDLNKCREKYVDYTENGEPFINILQWILKHQQQLIASPERLSFDFTTCIGHFTSIMRTAYSPGLEWEAWATEFKGTVYMANIIMRVGEEIDEDDELNGDESESEDESYFEDESDSEDELEFNYGLWGHTFEHYMRGGDPEEGVNCVEAYRCFLKTSIGGHTLLYPPKMDGVDPDLFQENVDTTDVFISLKCCKEISDERIARNFKRYKLRNWWDEHQLNGNPRIIVGYRNDDGIVHSLEMFKTADLPQIAKGIWDPNIGFNFLVEFLDFVKRKVHTDPGKTFIFRREANEHIYCKKLKRPYYILPTWYTEKLFANDNPENVEP